MVKHVTAGCFGNSGRYSVVQSHRGAAGPPLLGLQSFGNSWGFPWRLHVMNACCSGRVGCCVITSASSSMRSGYCSTDVADISRDTEDRAPDVSSQPKVTRWSVSRARRPTRPVAVACSSVVTGPVRPHRSEVNTIQALMDLALPRFEGLGDGPRQVHRSWMVSTESPASPDPGCLTDLLRRLPSPCLNLDALLSDDTEDYV